MNSHTEENYLKAIYSLSEERDESVSTNAIALHLSTKPSSVTDMLKKLANKNLIHYEKYQGVYLTKKGQQTAIQIIRKHRLWEVFLVEKLNFSWDEVHDIAEQLEHIESKSLIEKLDAFLGNPRFDPHGDPIPDINGYFADNKQVTLSTLKIKECGIVVGVKDSSSPFLKFLDKIHIGIGSKITVVDCLDFDFSKEILIDKNKKPFSVSQQVTDNIYIKKYA
jgi:DtxR family transcriptional regulator, Mn-dependent transcriptional regulator